VFLLRPFIIKARIKVGENAVIGAFSFVNNDIPANVIAVGVPANVIMKTMVNPVE